MMDDRLGAALLLFLLACAIACAGLLDNPDVTMPWEHSDDLF